MECRKTGQVSCEKNCALFHSCGVCAHTVAVAKKKGCLDSLVKWLSNRDNLNVTELTNSGLPKGAGKKGGTKREFSTKSSTKIVKRMLENVSDDVFTPRTGIITKSTGKHGLVESSLPPDTSLATSSLATFTDPSYLPHAPLPHVPPPLTSLLLHEFPPPVFPDLQSCINGSYSSPSAIP